MINQAILAQAQQLTDEQFRPHAEQADQGDIHGQVGDNVRALARAGYFGMGIATRYGGLGADEPTRREFTEMVASACGVTAFVQQQMHAGGGFVGNGRSEALKAQMLPQFASGQTLCGVAFSHLRRPGPPMLRAEPTPGGYRVNGVAPWVTGWALMDSLILGASLPGGDHLFAYVPKRGLTGEMTAGPRIPLAVMNASDTVEVTFADLFIPDDLVLYERGADALARGDFCSISGHVYLPLGCARGSIHFLRGLAERRHEGLFAEAADRLAREVDDCRTNAQAWSGACADLPDYKAHALQARASAIVLAVRAAHTAVTATGGSAHLLSQPPQRLLREAIFYTTTAQTRDVQSATMDLLLSPDCWQME